jgi:hypothetical protein
LLSSPDSLLSSYGTERRPVALTNSSQSVKNGLQIFGLLKTLGTTDPDITIAKANLYARITDPVTRLEVLKGVEGQREHFDNLGLHIGYIYGDNDVPASASLYTPSYRPGARLPHAWLSGAPTGAHLPTLPAIDNSYVEELSSSAVEQKRFSTLDLCAFDAFTLLFSSESAAHWNGVLEGVREGLGLAGPKGAAAAKKLNINTAVLGTDFELVKGKRADEWVVGLQLGHGGAVLVRPDQHILGCYGGGVGTEEVLKGVKEHLGL